MMTVSYVQPHLVHHMPQGGVQRPGRSRSPTSGTRSTSLSWEKISVGGRVWITGEGKVARGRKEEDSKSVGINKSPQNIKIVEEGDNENIAREIESLSAVVAAKSNTDSGMFGEKKTLKLRRKLKKRR